MGRKCYNVAREVIPVYEPLVAFSFTASVVLFSCRRSVVVSVFSLVTPVVEKVDTERTQPSLFDLFISLVSAVTVGEAISLLSLS